MKNKIIAIMLLGSFLLAGCSGASTQQQTIATEPVVAGTDYDVIVVGGDPEGVAAAVSAARNGMMTLLIEDDHALGGLMTLGMLNFIDMAESRDGTILTQGIFTEFYDAVGGTAFDVELAKKVFYDMVDNEPNATVKLNTSFVAPIMEGNEIVGVVVDEDGQQVSYRGSLIVDATVDADVAAASGVPYTIAGEDIGEKDRQMGVTLVFELSDIDWNVVTNYLENDDNEHTGANEKAAWGYTKEGYAYEPMDELMRLRGFNIARQDNGNVLINALIIFGVDALDAESKAQGIARAQKELEYIVPYVRENFVGFEQAKLVGTAEQLYVRESRHIIGEYQLTIDDVLENADQWDKIAIGNYPVDVQPTASQTYGTVIGSPDRYAIPFGSLVPLEIDNMLVVGRSASYTSLAAGSARVIPIGMAGAQGAGVAAAYAINNGMTVREVSKSEQSIQEIQKTLKAQGVFLTDIQVVEPVMSHWAYEGVKVIRALGLLDGGYSNDYRLDTEMTKWRYQNMVNKTLQKAGVTVDYIEVNDACTNQDIIKSIAKVMACEETEYTNQVDWLKEAGLISNEMVPYFSDSTVVPNAAEVIMLVANVYTHFTK